MPIDTRNPRLYLASRSPRRRELLTQMGIQFDTLAFRGGAREDSEVDETPHADEAPVIYVDRVARAKAVHGAKIAGWRRLRPQPVLAADTTLEFNGEIIGKPVDAEDARFILRRLSGRTHRVLTTVAVAFEGRLESVISVSEVCFGELTDDEIRRYVASGEPMDKAGAYGIQGRAGLFVKHLTGSYTGVMGLPLYETSVLLKRFGFPL
ncbi:Maf family protein [Propionivibrio limicola]|uniref:Maf family protein n=1 Tax=Propionivibrio limicola TaxID=167645 RepID=UPI0012927F43|nr:Maf family protein [Propionivibrio limicola]